VRNRYAPGELEHVVAGIIARLRHHRQRYDPRLRAAFVFADGRAGELLTFSVAEEEDALALPAIEPASPGEREAAHYDLAAALVRPPREHVGLFAELASTGLGDFGGRPPEIDEAVRAVFLLAEAEPGELLALTLREPETPREMQYLFLHDALYTWARRQPWRA
jgi:hypothetical protein